MALDVEYDFSAAASLSRALAQLHDKLIALRNDPRQRLHDQLLADCWKGTARDRFAQEFANQQKALGYLADRARQLQRQVDAATDLAHRAAKP